MFLSNKNILRNNLFKLKLVALSRKIYKYLPKLKPFFISANSSLNLEKVRIIIEFLPLNAMDIALTNVSNDQQMVIITYLIGFFSLTTLITDIIS